MPNMNDQRFRRSVIYLCAHSQEGAMGIIINRLAGGLSYGVLMSELGIDIQPQNNDRPVFFGGPIEPTRGFILHTTDHIEESSLLIDSIVDITKPRGQAQNIKAQNLKEGGKFSSKLALSTTTDMLRAIHQGKGPNKNILVLGYAGWGPGQLELELQTNSWLAVSADEDLIFGGDTSSKWKRALGKLGIDPAMLSSESGHA
ncbi:MAG: YqgE/AlgH family protein [Alphaproteobacteria bacterium]|nr:YqgE/AlgH family protein [Alphaproteobacteria bacterium]